MRVLIIFKDSVATERMAICYLSAALKKAGNEVRLWIMRVNPEEQLHEYMEEFKPDIVSFSAMTGEHLPLLELNEELKSRYEFFSVWGGPHATFAPELINEDVVDAQCTGEGDAVFPELCRRIEHGEEYWLTPTFNVSYGGEVFRNELADLIPTLEALEFPDREILYEADPRLSQLGTKYFMAARGCPYKCSYCFNVKYNESYKGKGKIIRSRTPRQVIDEIKWVKDRYPLDHVSFLDDLFILKPKGWLLEFADLFTKEIGLRWSCTVRANVTNIGGEFVLGELRKSGLSWVWMGVECGDEEISNQVLDRSHTNEEITEAVRLFQKYEINVIALNIMGLPVPNPLEIDLKTLDFNIMLRPAMMKTSLMYPYPGSPIETYARLHGYIDSRPEYLETHSRKSIMKMPSEKERRQVENLMRLSGVVVAFPFLRRHTMFLISLPLGRLYHFIFYLWYGYSFKFRFTKMTAKGMRHELPYFFKLFVRMMAKS